MYARRECFCSPHVSCRREHSLPTYMTLHTSAPKIFSCLVQLSRFRCLAGRLQSHLSVHDHLTHKIGWAPAIRGSKVKSSCQGNACKLQYARGYGRCSQQETHLGRAVAAPSRSRVRAGQSFQCPVDRLTDTERRRSRWARQDGLHYCMVFISPGLFGLIQTHARRTRTIRLSKSLGPSSGITSLHAVRLAHSRPSDSMPFCRITPCNLLVISRPCRRPMIWHTVRNRVPSPCRRSC